MSRNTFKELAEIRARLNAVEQLVREDLRFQTSVCIEVSRWAELWLQAANRMRPHVDVLDFIRDKKDKG